MHNKPGPTDTIPAWLSPGEAVLNKEASELLGRDTIKALNHKGLAMRKGIVPVQGFEDGTNNVQPVTQAAAAADFAKRTGYTPGTALGAAPAPTQASSTPSSSTATATSSLPSNVQKVGTSYSAAKPEGTGSISSDPRYMKGAQITRLDGSTGTGGPGYTDSIKPDTSAPKSNLSSGSNYYQSRAQDLGLMSTEDANKNNFANQSTGITTLGGGANLQSLANTGAGALGTGGIMRSMGLGNDIAKPIKPMNGQQAWNQQQNETFARKSLMDNLQGSVVDWDKAPGFSTGGFIPDVEEQQAAKLGPKEKLSGTPETAFSKQPTPASKGTVSTAVASTKPYAPSIEEQQGAKLGPKEKLSGTPETAFSQNVKPAPKVTGGGTRIGDFIPDAEHVAAQRYETVGATGRNEGMRKLASAEKDILTRRPPIEAPELRQSMARGVEPRSALTLEQPAGKGFQMEAFEAKKGPIEFLGKQNEKGIFKSRPVKPGTALVPVEGTYQSTPRKASFEFKPGQGAPGAGVAKAGGFTLGEGPAGDAARAAAAPKIDPYTGEPIKPGAFKDSLKSAVGSATSAGKGILSKAYTLGKNIVTAPENLAMAAEEWNRARVEKLATEPERSVMQNVELAARAPIYAATRMNPIELAYANKAQEEQKANTALPEGAPLKGGATVGGKEPTIDFSNPSVSDIVGEKLTPEEYRKRQQPQTAESAPQASDKIMEAWKADQARVQAEKEQAPQRAAEMAEAAPQRGIERGVSSYWINGGYPGGAAQYRAEREQKAQRAIEQAQMNALIEAALSGPSGDMSPAEFGAAKRRQKMAAGILGDIQKAQADRERTQASIREAASRREEAALARDEARQWKEADAARQSEWRKEDKEARKSELAESRKQAFELEELRDANREKREQNRQVTFTDSTGEKHITTVGKLDEASDAVENAIKQRSVAMRASERMGLFTNRTPEAAILEELKERNDPNYAKVKELQQYIDKATSQEDKDKYSSILDNFYAPYKEYFKK